MDTTHQLFTSSQLLEILYLSENATAVYTTEQVIIQMANDIMIGFWGKDRSVIGQLLEDAVPELKDQPFVKLLQQVWLTGKSYTAKDAEAFLKIDGVLQPFYFDFTYKAILNEQGEVYCILHTATNVTEQHKQKQIIKEAEQRVAVLHAELTASNNELTATNEELTNANQALRESEQVRQRTREDLIESESRFRNMINQSPIAMLLTRGENFVFEEINPPMLQLIGKDASIKGQPYYKAMPELVGQPVMDIMKTVYQTGEEWRGLEQPISVAINGVLEDRYYNLSYKPLLEDGRVVGIIQSAVDVTEQVNARQYLEQIIAEKSTLEIDLRNNEYRLQRILDTMAEGVGIIDTTGQLVYANQMAQKILGLRESEIKQRTYNDPEWQNHRVDGTLLPESEHPMSIMMTSGKPVYDHEIGVQPTDGERFYISINAAPLFDHNGNLSGGIGTFMDVTARRKDLQYKDDFISIASHELKTPVTSLKASLQLLDTMKENPSPMLLPRLVDQCSRSVDKITKLIDELMDASRMTQGHLQLNKTTFTIAEMLTKCCHHVRMAGKHNLVLQGDELLEIYADEHRIDQVVVNFVNNAVKYAPNSHDIFLTIEKIEGFAKVSVEDSGPGIAPEKVAHLFERYYQVEDGVGYQQAGLGLGLYISAEIIKKHGGGIGVDTMPGKGSSFWFTLPLIMENA